MTLLGVFAVSASLPVSAQSRSSQQIIAECDRLAASPYDTQRKAEGVDFNDINTTAVIKACRRAVQVNDIPRLQFQFGRSLVSDDQDEQALNWYPKAARKNYAIAQYSMGWMYINGRGVEKNETEAVKWYRKAAEQGLHFGQHALGMMYASGRGVAKNNQEAVRWYQKAANQGHDHAMDALGLMYQEGRGVAQSDVQAVHWYRQSVEKGNASAMNNLEAMYHQGRGKSQSDV